MVDKKKQQFQLISDKNIELKNSLFGSQPSPSDAEKIIGFDFRSISALHFTDMEKCLLANQGYHTLERRDWKPIEQRESVMKRQDPEWYRDGIVITVHHVNIPHLKIASAHLPGPNDSNTTEQILTAFVNACGMKSVDVLIGDLNRYGHIEHSYFTDLTKDSSKTTLSANGELGERGPLDKALLRKDGCSWILAKSGSYPNNPEICAPPLKEQLLKSNDRKNYISDHALLKVVLQQKLDDRRSNLDGEEGSSLVKRLKN